LTSDSSKGLKETTHNLIEADKHHHSSSNAIEHHQELTISDATIVGKWDILLATATARMLKIHMAEDNNNIHDNINLSLDLLTSEEDHPLTTITEVLNETSKDHPPVRCRETRAASVQPCSRQRAEAENSSRYTRRKLYRQL